MFILLATLFMTGSGIYYCYMAGYYNVRRFDKSLFVIIVILSVFFSDCQRTLKEAHSPACRNL
jgi:hypothetical protein